MTDRKPHVHAGLIKQWADGAEVQKNIHEDVWNDDPCPRWEPTFRYRIKPPPHRWRREMDAWEAGKTVQFRQCRASQGAPAEPDNKPGYTWEDLSLIKGKVLPHHWDSWWLEFRIKPEAVEVLKWVDPDGTVYHEKQNPSPNLKLTLVDGKLTKAEVL